MNSIDNSYQSSVGQYYLYPTMGCSLSCSHCFIDKDIRQSKMSMSIEDFKHVVDEYARHFTHSNANHAEITIMGGEPTTLKPEFFHSVIPYIRSKFSESGKYYYITLMTNLLHSSCLNKIYEHFDFVATSYEPNRFVNYPNQRDTWFRNLTSLIESNRQVTLSFTTTKDVIEEGLSLYDYFYDLGVRYFQINKAFPEGELLRNHTDESSYQDYQQKRHAELMKAARSRKIITTFKDREDSLFVPFSIESDYLISVSEWMLSKLNAGQNVRVDPLLDYPLGIYSLSEIGDLACGAGKGFSVRPDGLTTGCAAEIGNIEPLSFGNILVDSIETIEKSEVRKNLLKAQFRIRRECMVCEFIKSCKGGCMLRSRSWDPESLDDCHGNKKFLEYVKNNKSRFISHIN